MTYALLVTEFVETKNNGLDDSAKQFLMKTKGIEGSIAPESKLSIGCWQLNLQTHMTQFATLIRQASESQVSFRVAFFEKGPSWCIETSK